MYMRTTAMYTHVQDVHAYDSYTHVHVHAYDSYAHVHAYDSYSNAHAYESYVHMYMCISGFTALIMLLYEAIHLYKCLPQ